MAPYSSRTKVGHAVSAQDPDTGAWDTSVPVTLPWRPTSRPSTMSKKDLAPYSHRFPKLYGERRYAQNYPLRPFRFLDLPPEVRNKVYRQVFVLGDAIELTPKSTGRFNHRAHDKHMKRYKYDIIPRLRLLRVNKQVNEEATSIFYGENEFRFTNVDGWYILSAFLKTIGLRNARMLRSIAVHVPWFGKALDNRHDGLPESINKMKSMRSVLDGMGLKHPYRWSALSMLACVRRCTKILDNAGMLESVVLILPDSHSLGTIYGDSLQRLHAPSIALVRLHGGFCDEKSDDPNKQQVTDAHRLEVLRTHVDVWDWFEIECGWELETAVYEKHGRYPVEMREDDTILDLGEVLPMVI